jgi:hypothetical protein
MRNSEQSVTEFVSNPADQAGAPSALILIRGSLTGAGGGGVRRIFERGKKILDLAFDRKPPRLGLGENQLSVDHDVELAGLARLYLSVLAESLVNRSGQTGRARFITSS